MSVAILDVDGTLVDTNYQHALAWFRAFRSHGVVLPIWRIHRHVGMGGDQLVEAMAGEALEREQGDSIREQETERYNEMIDEVEPFDGARELILALRDRGHDVVLASSAKKDEIEHYIDLLKARDLAEWTSSADVESTKPDPDLIESALERSGAAPRDAVMVGDTPWDVKAAKAAGVDTIAVMTGGFSREELVEAGAIRVYESVAELCRVLDDTPLRAG